MDRGAWWAVVRGVEKSDRTERLTPSHILCQMPRGRHDDKAGSKG